MPTETEENHKCYSATQLNLRTVNFSITRSVSWGFYKSHYFLFRTSILVLTKEKSNLLPGFVRTMLQPRDSHFFSYSGFRS